MLSTYFREHLLECNTASCRKRTLNDYENSKYSSAQELFWRSICDVSIQAVDRIEAFAQLTESETHDYIVQWTLAKTICLKATYKHILNEDFAAYRTHNFLLNRSWISKCSVKSFPVH